MFLRKRGRILALMTLCLPIASQAEDVEVRFSTNESFILPVDQEDSVYSIKKNIAAITGYAVEDQVLSVDISNEMVQKEKLGYRNYHEDLSETDQKDLYFIMKTLALKSLLELAKYKSKLEKAGDRIDHVHPLNFLAAIFTDEELKAYIHAIKKRGSWVWDKFISGLGNTMDEELKQSNMPIGILDHFTKRVGIDIQIVLPAYEKKDWGDFVKLLITNIPREGDADRYDM